MRLLYTVVILTGTACSFDASDLLPGSGNDRDAGPGRDGRPPVDGDDGGPDGGPEPLDLLCRTLPTYMNRPGSSHAYRVLPPGNYDRAAAQCAADEAHLTVIDDSAENSFVNTLAAGELWIGYDDLTQEGTFAWITQVTPTFDGFAGPEPSNTNGEDCVVLRDNGSWNDVGCELTRPAICECDPFRAPTPVPSCMNDPGYSVDSDGRRRKVTEIGDSWDDARDDCIAGGAHLAVVGDSEENQLLDDLLDDGDAWIGYRSAVSSDGFSWINGAPVGFENWDGGEPNASAQCAELDQFDGRWSTVDCTQNRDYVCECDPAAP